MMLNITVEENDLLKFNVKSQDGTIVEIIAYHSQYGDSLKITSNIGDQEIDSTSVNLSEVYL